MSCWSERVTLHLLRHSQTQRLLSLSPYEAARQVRPEFLCCFIMVLCLALHLIEPDVQLQLGYTSQETVELAKVMFSAAQVSQGRRVFTSEAAYSIPPQAVLWASDFLGSHSLDHLQCIVLMGVYQFNVDDQSDAGWALLGSAIKVAQNLGLSRLATETESRKAVWPEAWKSFRRREIGRRVWWNLVSFKTVAPPSSESALTFSPLAGHARLVSSSQDTRGGKRLITCPTGRSLLPTALHVSLAQTSADGGD